MKKLLCFIGLFFLVMLLFVLNCVYTVYLIIDEVLFLLTFKRCRFPVVINDIFLYPLGKIFGLVLACMRGLVGKRMF
ncbi:MAG: hypothetical protein RL662_154 [Bacteroidota bacterium]